MAIASKSDVDEAFFELSTRMLREDAQKAGVRAGIATHDMELVRRIRKWASGRGVGDDKYEFQMLYGIKTQEQVSLAEAGQGIRILVSYGSHWFPWYVRRLAERPANVAFVVKSMFS